MKSALPGDDGRLPPRCRLGWIDVRHGNSGAHGDGDGAQESEEGGGLHIGGGVECWRLWED